MLDGSQYFYFQIYRQADHPLRRLGAKNNFLVVFPRYALEALGMVSIASLGGLLALQRGNGVSVVPLLGSLGLGAQRLLPALQQIYGGWASLKGYNAQVQSVLFMLKYPMPRLVADVQPLRLREGISLTGFCFRYDQMRRKC